MSHDRPWKRFERAIATSLHTLRTPLSGGASRITRSDSLHPELYIECKMRSRSATVRLFAATATAALTECKVPVLALRESGQAGTVAVVSWDTFTLLYECWTQNAVAIQQLKEIGATWKA